MGLRFDTNLTPFDLGQELNQFQSFGDFNPQQKIGTVTKPGAIRTFGDIQVLDPLTGKPLRGPSTTEDVFAQKNIDAFQKSLTASEFGRFNNPVNIERQGNEDAVTKTFADQIKFRETLSQQGQNALNVNVGKIFANFVEKSQRDEAIKGVPLNSMGRIQLVRRLRRQFGPGFATIPAAQKVLKQFDDAIGAQQDVANLNKLVAQGKTALSFLSNDKLKVPDFVQNAGDLTFSSLVGSAIGG